MDCQGLKKTTIVFFICVLLLFITNRVLDVFVEKIELCFLIVSFVKLILIFFVYYNLRKEQKKVSSLFKNWPVFIFIIVVVTYLSYSNTQKIIDSKGIDVKQYFHLIYLFESFATGFFEEILCRIFLFYSLVNSNFFRIENRTFKSYITISFIFGFCHITNLFHYDFFSVANQILLAFGLGLIFQLLFSKFRNIIFIASLHSLINYFGMRNTTLFKIESIAESVDSLYVQNFVNIGVIVFIDLIIIVYVYLFIKKRV
jgi:membrane protease YdiL (CAAX protease family)